ncbi:hypothetical protein [Rothia mucilaginosa]|uniref:hypothetical protein n=1 Tax=Rothia mucilaginosa TaxID=43675 RepID=UPI0028E64D56|nr:hypothetical protein [Rothia mucilaginosa]
MKTTRPASMKDYQEMQNIVPATLSIPVLKMPISPEEARKENPQTAEIRMLVIGLNRPVTPMRSFVGDGVLILAQTPAWEKASQEIYEASVAGDKGRMLEVMLTLAAEYLELQKPSDIFDFAVSISEA